MVYVHWAKKRHTCSSRDHVWRETIGFDGDLLYLAVYANMRPDKCAGNKWKIGVSRKRKKSV